MKQIYLVIITFLLVSCGHTNNNFHLYQQENITDSSEVIDISCAVNNIHSTFDTLTESIKLIPLETNDKSIIGTINQLITTPDYFYILDHYKNGSVAIFKSDGRFVKRLPIGLAPHEISMASRIYFSNQDTTLYVHNDGNNKISKFTKNGDYISNININGLLFIDFAVFNDKKIFIQPSFQSKVQKFSVVITNDTVVHYWILGNDDNMISFPYVQSGNNCILISKPLDDYVYCFDGNKIFKKYKVITNKSIDYSKLEGEESHTKIYSQLSNQDFVYADKIVETSNYQLLQHLSVTDIFSYAVRNRKNNIVWGERFHNTFFSALSYSTQIGVHDYNNNVFNGVLMPTDLLSPNPLFNTWDGSDLGGLITPEDMQKLKNLKEDDNPVIVLFKLKSE